MEIPNMLWLKVDLNNKELPLEMADSAEELARICGVTEVTIRTAAARAAHGQKSRYVKVWVGH